MQKRKHISKVGLVLLTSVVFLVTFAVGALIGNQLQNGTMVSTMQGIIPGGRLNILFMGIDARSNEENSRSDTMILVSIDKKSKDAVMVWIPRDTRVKVSAGYYDKINSVNYLQGPEEACRITGELLGENVKYYVVTNFDGFAEIVDILGGVHIDVESNMYHHDPDPKLNINLSKGMQLLNGNDALRYVRYRGGPTADIGRTQRQAKFIKALLDEMINTSTISKLPELLPKLMENVHTNLPINELGTLANMARNFSAENMITQTLPGYPFTDRGNGASYWHADEEITPGMIDALFAGKTFEVMSDPPNLTSPASSPARPAEEIVEEDEPEADNPEDLIDPAEDNPDGTSEEPGSDTGGPVEEIPDEGSEDSSGDDTGSDVSEGQITPSEAAI